MGILSLRNIFLAGFIYFQLYGAIYPLWINYYQPYYISDPASAASRFVLYSLAFMSLFLGSYALLTPWLIRRHRGTAFQSSPPPRILASMALVLAIAAFYGRFSGAVPIVGPLINHMLVSTAAAATCLASVAIFASKFNPLYLALGAIVVLFSLINTTLAAFGRRGLVGVLGAIVVGAAFSSFRWNRRLLLVLLPVLVIAGVFFVAAFSQIRGDLSTQGSLYERTVGIQENLSMESVFDLFNVPDTGVATLFLIDSRPDDFDYDNLLSVRYFFIHLAPRQLFPSKIEPLSRRIPIEANRRGVALGLHTVGPGIIGHAAADGGLYAAVLYGLILGGIFAALDSLLDHYRYSILAVAALFSALGQTFSLARGESSIMLGIMLIGIFSNLILFYGFDKLLRGRHPAVATPALQYE